MLTVEHIVTLARRTPSLEFRTESEKELMFTIMPYKNGTGIKIIREGNDPQWAGHNRLKEYLDTFNNCPPGQKPTYPEEYRFNSYIPLILKKASELTFGRPEPTNLAEKPTDGEALRRYRLGQERFRTALITLRKHCYVTGIADAEFLRASHIKQWSESTNAERLDPHNGLLLSPNYDHLFDRAYISFEDDGHILLSKNIPREIIHLFGIDVNFIGGDLGEKTKPYLRHHRARFHSRETNDRFPYQVQPAPT